MDAQEQQKPLPKIGINGEYSDVEIHRKEGQKQLKDLVVAGTMAGTIDWEHIIALAADLHRKEQDIIKSRKKKPTDGYRAFLDFLKTPSSSSSPPPTNYPTNYQDSSGVGAFSINLSSYYTPVGRLQQCQESANMMSTSSSKTDTKGEEAVEACHKTLPRSSTQGDIIFEEDDEDFSVMWYY